MKESQITANDRPSYLKAVDATFDQFCDNLLWYKSKTHRHIPHQFKNNPKLCLNGARGSQKVYEVSKGIFKMKNYSENASEYSFATVSL